MNADLALRPAQPVSNVCADFRLGMRRLAGGITVITTELDGAWFGMTATAVSSLSMEPPALIACINRNASIAEPLRARGAFCVNLLGHDHEDICRVFSTKLSAKARFATGEWRESEEGLPWLADGQASVFCRVDGLTDYGTHTIVIGRVFRAEIPSEMGPLIALDGQIMRAAPKQ